ncbi:hypothetical protein M8J76_003132 [Diaphorina citri]|nr:hypothetical protein M8J76_003132 [Diaphorina citri]
MKSAAMTTNSLKRINKDENIDDIRQRNIAYEYLCHLEEAKIWIESCIKETLPPSTELESNLRNGIVLAKLGHYLDPEIVPESKIYDADFAVYNRVGLRFRHTDNINYFIKATFLPETVDIYESKNMPRLIYCIHALSRHLFRTGHAPLIQDLFGKSTQEGKMDSLKSLNDAIREKNIPALRSLLRPPAYHTIETLLPSYTTTLYNALQEKIDQLQNHSLNDSFEPDEYTDLLTQAEIQGYLSQLNIEHVWDLLMVQGSKRASVWETLRHQHVNVQNIVRDHESYYHTALDSYLSTHPTSALPSNEKLATLQRLIYNANESALTAKHRRDLLRQINSLLGRMIESRARGPEGASSRNVGAGGDGVPAKEGSCIDTANRPLRSVKLTASFCRPWSSAAANGGRQWASVSASGLNKMAAKQTPCANGESGNGVTQSATATSHQVPVLGYKACLNELYDLLSYDSMELKSSVNRFALPLYFEDLLEEKQHAGIYPRLQSILAHCNCVANISKSLDTSLPALFWDALRAPQLRLAHLNPDLKREYASALKSCRQFKEQNLATSSVLSLSNIRKCIELVNAEHDIQSKTINTLVAVNNLLLEVHTKQHSQGQNIKKYLKPLLGLLNEPCLGLTELSELDDTVLLFTLLTEKFSTRAASNPDPSDTEDETACLWLEEIQDTVQHALLIVQNIRLFIASQREESENSRAGPKADGDPRVGSIFDGNSRAGPNFIEDKRSDWFEEDKENRDVINVRAEEDATEGWEVFNIANRNVYIDLRNGKYSWTPPSTRQASAVKLSKPRRSLDSTHIYKNERLFVKLQARCRGYLARREFEQMFWRRERARAAVCLQRWWRNLARRRRRLVLRAGSSRGVERQVSTVSARGAPVKRKREDREESFPDRMAYYAANEEKIVKVQALWRGKMVRNIYMMLFSSPGNKTAHHKQPTYKMLKQFVKHLDTNIVDYHTAIELQRMRNELSKLIIKNKNLSKCLEDLDLKIFLLVQNRLSLSDILKCRTDLALAAVDCGETQTKNALLEKYAYLLYILQVRPEYLVRLVLSVPHTSTQKFLQGITLTLYNSGQTSRDEYLLLKCLSLLLREEINNSDKYMKPLDIITTPPVAMKIIMHYAREKCGHMSLKTILKSLIEKILKENSLILGDSTSSKKILNNGLAQGSVLAPLLFALYIADIPETKSHKFGYADDWALATSSSKASDLPANVDDVQTALSYEHVSRTLTSGIQKLESTTNMFLKRIVASKEYIPYGLLYMISQLRDIMQVKFGDQKSDESQPRSSLYPDLQTVIGHYLYYNFINSAIVAPEAYKIISLRPGQEISTEQRHNLATVAKLLQFSAAKKGYGEDSSYLMCLNKFISYCHDRLRVFFEQCCQANKTPVSFVLSNKLGDQTLHTACSDEESVAKLFIQAKELLVVVLPCLGGHTLPGALRMETTKEQEDLFQARVAEIVKYNPAFLSYTQTSLKSLKVKLRKYLSTLEESGYVTKDNGYQEIELQTVRETRDCLLERIAASTEKISYYEKYISSCLQNQTLGKRNVHLTICSNDKHDRKLQHKLIITYTGKQLFEKGILVEAEGLDEKQLKNVLIEFKPRETYGAFQINGKFMGVQMESAEINIQDLLQKKFLGISIMDIFGKAKVNVNLLLHLLNKKYYSKH